MKLDTAIAMFGACWTHHTRQNFPSRCKVKRFASLDIAYHTVEFQRILGKEGSSLSFATLEEARVSYAADLMRQARENLEEIELLDRRFFRPHPIKTPARLALNLLKGRRRFYRDAKAELAGMREQAERILAYGSAEKLASDLEQLTNVTVTPLEEDLDVPEPVYGRGEHDVILYQVNVPYYITKASSYWIQECRIDKVRVIQPWHRGADGYDLEYTIQPLVEADDPDNISPKKRHQEIDDLITGRVDNCGTGLYGRHIYASKEKALALINETKAKAMKDLQKDVTWYVRPEAV